MTNLRAEAQDGRTVRLSWRAGRSASQAPVTVQHRTDSTAAWTDLGTVRPADSVASEGPSSPSYRFEAEDLKVGTHQFRLAVAPDGESGSKQTSRAVTARIELEDDYRLRAYPSPVRERATVELAVKEDQNVTVAVYDVLGRHVTTLHDGHLPAQETRRFSLEASRAGLTSGTYFVRIQGEGFAATERLTVIQ